MNRYLIRAADAITGFSPNTDFYAQYRLVNSHYCCRYCSNWYVSGEASERSGFSALEKTKNLREGKGTVFQSN